MTTIPDRPNTALVVIDVQTDVVARAHERDRVVANISSLVHKARAEAVPVVWVQHNDDGLPRGSDGWQLVPELAPADGEPIVHKTYGDAFDDTDLEEVLAEEGTQRSWSPAPRPTSACAPPCTVRWCAATTPHW